MPRIIARLLLVFVLAGVFAPLVQALSADPPHACCLRRLHGSADHPPQFHDSVRHDGNCCPPITTSHSARVLTDEGAVFQPRSSPLIFATHRGGHAAGFGADNSPRAPPFLLFG